MGKKNAATPIKEKMTKKVGARKEEIKE